MTSEAKLEANRQNAKKSTGPKTPKGKAVVSKNAMKHGLLSSVTLIEGECEQTFREFEQQLYLAMAPASELEILLVDRIISTAWRLKRVISMETITFNLQQNDPLSFDQSVMLQSDLQPQLLFSRYEVQLERSLYKAIRELREIQRNRPTPAMEPVLELDANDP